MRLCSTILLILFCIVASAQVQQPSNLPTTNSPNSWLSYRAILDSFNMFVERDTFSAKYPTLLKHTDHNFYYSNGNGTRWYKLVDTVNLSARINLKVSYSDTLSLIATKKNLSDTSSVLRALIAAGGGGSGGIDTIYAHYDTLYWRKSGVTKYTRIDTFDANFKVIGVNNYFQWLNGDSVPAKGLSPRELLLLGAKKCIHPTYTTPAASISSLPAATTYEYGTNLGTVTLSSGFTQNNAGTVTSTTYYVDGSPIGGNLFSVSSLTAQKSMYVTKAYGQGACINDNCGVSDCTGRINAGSVSSGVIYLTPFSYRYWGWTNTSTPSDGTVQGLTKDAGGLALTVTNTTPTGSQYFVYYHPTSSGSITNIVVNGFPSTSAFTISTVTFVNARGYSSSYQKIVSNNALSATTTFVFQ